MRAFLLVAFFTFLFAFRSPESTVYLCSTGTAYHHDRSCRGLSQCKHEIITVTQEEAVNKYGRKICGWED